MDGCHYQRAGVLIQLSQAFYFQALKHSEAGIVAAYWNMVPALLPLASFLLFSSAMAGWQYAGVCILVLASVCFCLVDTNLRGRRQSLFLMAGASAVQVVAILIEKYVFEEGTFFVGFLLITLGIILVGSAPLLMPTVRTAFSRKMLTLRPAIPMILGIEIANLIALFMSQRAVALGVPSLVLAVEATLPAYPFALGILLLATTRRFGDVDARRWLGVKLTLVPVMAFGVWLVPQLPRVMCST